MNDHRHSLSLIGISKSFPGVKALDGVSLDIQAGEVHALCGENGAGKSTLMNILSGNLQPDEGQILLDGEEVVINDQKHAQQLGVGMVYQERSLVSNLSIAENIFAEHQPLHVGGFIDYGSLYQQARALLQKLGLPHLRVQTRVDDLPVAEQQMVEIAKALSQHPSILLLDEPTAALTEAETEVLFRIIGELKAEGVAIIYISHRLAEIFEVADRVSILKDGQYQGSFPVNEIDAKGIIRRMVGRDLVQDAHQSYVHERVVLDVRGLSGARFQNVSFQLRQGEILALAGLVGAGRSEVARAIMGIDPKRAGEVRVRGLKVSIQHPAEAIALHMGYVPESRKEQGLFLSMSVEANVVAANLPVAASWGFLSTQSIRKHAMDFIQRLSIKTRAPQQSVLELSGGNQQKIVLAKWLLVQPEILIVDEPTHGVDVGAKAEIYRLLRELAARGTAILLISSELPEVLILNDRVLVMYQGQLMGELTREEASEPQIMHLASGVEA